MSKNSVSDLSKSKTDILLSQSLGLTHDLMKVTENPEYKYFDTERFREKIKCLVIEEFNYQIEDDLDGAGEDKKTVISTVSRVWTKIYKE